MNKFFTLRAARRPSNAALKQCCSQAILLSSNALSSNAALKQSIDWAPPGAPGGPRGPFGAPGGPRAPFGPTGGLD